MILRKSYLVTCALLLLGLATGCSKGASTNQEGGSPPTQPSETKKSVTSSAIELEIKRLRDARVNADLTSQNELKQKALEKFDFGGYLFLLSNVDNGVSLDKVGNSAFLAETNQTLEKLSVIKSEYEALQSAKDQEGKSILTNQAALFLAFRAAEEGSHPVSSTELRTLVDLNKQLEKGKESDRNSILLDSISENHGLTSGVLESILSNELPEKSQDYISKNILKIKGPDQVDFGSRKYPLEVSLAGQFQTTEKTQIGGTCHIFASTFNAEAACYRKEHLRVKLSEAYLFYQHIRDRLKNASYFHLDFSQSGMITYMDGGDLMSQEKTYRHILKLDVLSEEELPFSEEFIRWFKDPIDEYRKIATPDLPSYKSIITKFFDPEKYNNQSSVLDRRFPSILKDKVDQKFFSRFSGAKRTPDDEVQVRSHDRLIQKCFSEPYDYKQDAFSYEKAVSLLSQGIPFVCNSRIQYSGSSKAQPHAFNVIGYRYSKSFDGGIEFQTYDSNLGKPVWGWNIPKCRSIFYVDGGVGRAFRLSRVIEKDI